MGSDARGSGTAGSSMAFARIRNCLPVARDRRRQRQAGWDRLTTSKALFGLGILLLLLSLPLLFSVGPFLAIAGATVLIVSIAVAPRR